MSSKIILNAVAKKVLNHNQQKLIPLLEDFSTTHFLAGGTAVALYLWHRESIDFDFFGREKQWTFADFVYRIREYGFDVSDEDKARFAGAEFEPQDEIHVTISQVRVSLINFFRTLYSYQHIEIEGKDTILGGLRIASLEELATMKLYAMITRKKWKDAVDLYFLLHHLNTHLDTLLELAEEKYFIQIFNRLAVLEQLISMDWDKTESVHYLIDNPPSDKTVESYLKDEALEILKKLS